MACGAFQLTHHVINDQEKIWILDTEGVALAKVLAAEHVDSRRTVSNHVPEIFEVLGIEAARASLLNEIRAVISFDGRFAQLHPRCRA